MSKGGSKQRFNTSPGLAASTNRLPPSMRARETAFCKEGFSQRLWALTCGVSGPSTFLPTTQPATEVFNQILRLTALPRLSTMQVRAGVLQVHPALVMCHSSIQQSGLTLGNGCKGTGSSVSPGAGVMGMGHPVTILATKPAQQWGNRAGVAAAAGACPLLLATCRPGSGSQPPQAF